VSINTTKYPKHLPDHSQNFVSSFLVNILPVLQISRKSTHNFLGILLTNKHTNAGENIIPPDESGGRYYEKNSDAATTDCKR